MNASHLFFCTLVLIGFSTLLGCAVSRAKKLERWHQVTPLAAATSKAVGANLHYLGCGGFLLEYSGEKILIDPFFSNVGMVAALTCKLESDTSLINGFFRERLGNTLDTASSISAVLISHAHHDHLADVPALLQNNLSPDKIIVYGSRTVASLLRSYPGLVQDTARQIQDLEKRFSVFSVSPKVNSQPEISQFFYSPGRRIRFAAVPSTHAGHYFFIKGQKLPGTEGRVDKPLKKPPTRVMDFKEGQNFNFLIDLLDESGEPVFRIFSNAGAACDAGLGLPPRYSLDEKPVDLLLICGANYNIAENYPFALLEHLRAPTVFVAHWENFFKPIPKLHKRPEVVPNTNIPKLMRKLKKFSRDKGFPNRFILEQPLGSKFAF